MRWLDYGKGLRRRLGCGCGNVFLPARLDLVDRDAKVDKRKVPGDLFVCATGGNQAIDVMHHLAVSFNTLMLQLG